MTEFEHITDEDLERLRIAYESNKKFGANTDLELLRHEHRDSSEKPEGPAA